MGVDIAVKIRIFKDNQEEYNEVTVSEQDNSLGSLFFSNEISYTSIKFDRQQELSAEENQLLDLTGEGKEDDDEEDYEDEEDYDDEEDEDDGMTEYSKISDAKEVLLVIDKIYNKLYRRKREALNNDLDEISKLEISEEDKIKRRTSKISDYFDFESSFSIFRGIIKSASEQGSKIQIIHEFY